MIDEISVIDLFAGPGGLGEGFSAFMNNVFKIKLSIEMNKEAHLTLELRSFFHQFKRNNKHIPQEYYSFLKGEISREKLFELYPLESKCAKNEAWCAELGKEDPDSVNRRVRKAIGKNKNWVLIGGPPCQAYSLVGRSRIGGIDENDHRVYLYKEYLRIIAFHKPAVFIMENVKGLLSAKINKKSIFEMMKNDLSDPSKLYPESNNQGYKIYSLVKKTEASDMNENPVYKRNRDFLIEAEEYGIPQKRHRIILLGIRNDIEWNPRVLEKKEKVTLSDVISDLPVIRSKISRMKIDSIIKEGIIKSKYESIPDSKVQWLKYQKQFKRKLGIPLKNNYSFDHGNGANFIQYPDSTSIKLKEWYYDERLCGCCNHESRSHLLQDLERYLFSADFMKKNEHSPKLSDYSLNLLPDHQNASSGKFNDRFKVQNPDKPATTVTSHISKDGHYFIHYDINQCRSLTVREAARIQTFPDNYLFCGSRTAQFHQVGNAVPPLLARQIAEIVFKIIGKNNE